MTWTHFGASLALCEVNPPTTTEFQAQMPVMQGFWTKTKAPVNVDALMFILYHPDVKINIL